MSADAAGTAERSRLREATLDGLRWVSGARLASEVVGLAAMVVLAHLISPAQFGIAVAALVVQELALVAVGDGVGAALVQRPRVERAHLESGAFLGIAAGALLSLAAFLGAPLAGAVFGDEATGMVRLIAPVFLISSLAIVPAAVLQRRLDFRRTSMAEVTGTMTRALTAVALALAGLDAAAIVVGSLAAATACSAVYLALGPSVLPRPHRRELVELVRFGAPAALSGITFNAFRNVDYAILGARLGPAALGLYWRAYQLGVDYQRKVTAIATRMALPVYSRAGGVADMRAIRMRVMRLQSLGVLPVLSTFAITAPELVPWAFGEQWRPAVVPAQILAVAGMLVSLQSGIGPLVTACGHPGRLLAFNAGSTLVYGGAVWVAAPHGLNAVCGTVAGFHALQLVVAHLAVAGPVAGVRLRQLAAETAPALAGCAALAAVAIPARELLLAAGGAAPLVAAGAALAGGGAYVAMIATAFPAARADLTIVLRRMVPSRKLASQPDVAPA